MRGEIDIQHPARSAIRDVLDVALGGESRRQWRRWSLPCCAGRRLGGGDGDGQGEDEERLHAGEKPPGWREVARGDANCRVFRIARMGAVSHKAVMFALGGDVFPHDNASLVAALNSGLVAAGLGGDAVAIEGDFPSLGALRIDLTGAQMERQGSLHSAHGPVTGGFFARVVEIVAAPARLSEVPVQMRLHAEDCVVAFGTATDGTRVARLQKCSSGSVEASVVISDIEATLLGLARNAAAEHGAEVQSVRLAVEAKNPREVALTATAVAKAMFFTATLTIGGCCEIDAEGNARLSGITCTGDGMIANLAASKLRPRLAEWEGRAFPIAPLLPEGQRLEDVVITTGTTLTIRAPIGNGSE
jgi:hypothetical protein